MYTFTFRVILKESQLDVSLTLQADGYYDHAVIVQPSSAYPLLKDICALYPKPMLPPCGHCFSFDEPFSPFDLYYAINQSSLNFEVETDYPGDLTKWPPVKGGPFEPEGTFDELLNRKIEYIDY